MTAAGSLVTLKYDELVRDDPALFAKIQQGFGTTGLGIVTVSGVPDLPRLRHNLLLLGDRFARLPEEVKQRYADPLNGLGVVGWSQGLEALEDGRPDAHKGSFYANPVHDVVTSDLQLLRAFPSYLTPNIWPDDDLPELRPAFQELGNLMIEVGLLIARQCDRFARSQVPALEQGHLEGIIRESPIPKARLLHYYPTAATASGTDRAWCSEHTDHGSLTGLLSALYTREGKEVPNPDPEAGLYIRTQVGGIVQAIIPADHIAFQMGEAMQVHSGGVLRATRHFVRAPSFSSAANVSRNTLAIFMQPKWDQTMAAPGGITPAEVGIGQWKPGISFGEFSKLTFQKYYSSSGS